MYTFAVIEDGTLRDMCAVECSELGEWVRQFRWQRKDGSQEWDPEWVAYDEYDVHASSPAAYDAYLAQRPHAALRPLEQLAAFDFPRWSTSIVVR